MNCWEMLGIDPTRDQAAIDQAYEQQKKFVADDDLAQLQQAYQEASRRDFSSESSGGRLSDEQRSEEPEPESADTTGKPVQPTMEPELTAEEQQVVREVVIQIKALLNDSRRAADEGIWKAILTEPPADKPGLRAAVANALEPQIRPMADNGSFPFPVVAFLGDWFGWGELQEKTQLPSARDESEPSEQPQAFQSEAGDDSQPSMTSFWPAVIGWVVALGVLAVFFDGIFGG